MKNTSPFGGKVIVFGGDFRQIPPVIPKGTREDIVDACFKQSILWKGITVLKLKLNMRLANPNCSNLQEQREYADWILKIGEGRVGGQEIEAGMRRVTIPDDILLPSGATYTDLINAVYPDIHGNIGNGDYLVKRAILCPTNDNVRVINERMLDAFPGTRAEYLSADTLEDGDDEAQRLYPSEFLNSLSPSGLPPHRLILKIGMPVILLRNLRPKDGLCNGTRLICKRFHQHYIEVDIITGANAGSITLIPRIELSTSSTDLPFKLHRRQFPVSPAFAMTINKSQGQTLDYVGICLPTPVFSHGQL
jgi:ATP-dependent DNA helicase PIF1